MGIDDEMSLADDTPTDMDIDGVEEDVVRKTVDADIPAMEILGDTAGEVKEKVLSTESEKPAPPLSRRERIALLPPNHPYHYTCGLPNFVFFAMAMVSFLYAVIVPFLLWRAAADKPTSLIWTWSILACSYGIFWIISLSEVLGVIVVFFRVSYVALVAAASTQLVGSITGVSIVYLDTFYVAGMVGYAVAEYRMRRGIEECPSAVAAMPPLISQEQERNREVNVFYAAFMFGLVSLVTVGRMAWLVFFSNAGGGGGGRISSVLEELSVETCFVSFQWTAFVALPLSLVSFNALFCWVPICYVAWHVLGAILGALVGSVAIEVLFFWLAAVAMAGFFGYCLAVHARCKRLLAICLENVIELLMC
uniref:Transmembrane protein n=1 Tax=Oryza barthii TaxID=65489 RepID=A0A0D3HIK4_9ORYZ